MKKKVKHQTGRPREFKPREKPDCFHEKTEFRNRGIDGRMLPKEYWFKVCTNCKDVEWVA